MEHEIYDFALGYASKRGFNLDDGVTSEIAKLAGSAAEVFDGRFSRFANHEQLSASFSEMAKAQMAFFVESMIAAKEEVFGVDDISGNVIGGHAFAEAKGWICPMFPLC